MSRAKSTAVKVAREPALLAQAGWVRDDAATAWRLAADGRCADALRLLAAAQRHLESMRARVEALAAEGRKPTEPPRDLPGLLAYFREGGLP